MHQLKGKKVTYTSSIYLVALIPSKHLYWQVKPDLKKLEKERKKLPHLSVFWFNFNKNSKCCKRQKGLSQKQLNQMTGTCQTAVSSSGSFATRVLPSAGCG